jgi:hypothetical protein
MSFGQRLKELTQDSLSPQSLQGDSMFIKTTNGWIRPEAIDILDYGEHTGCEHTTKAITSTGQIRFIKGHLDEVKKIVEDSLDNGR